MLPVIFSLWIIFNSRLTLEVALLGMVISAAVYWFARKYLGYAPGDGGNFARLTWRVLRYAAVLVVVLNDDLFCVHSLNSSLAEDIDKSVFVKHLTKFEDA